MIQLTDAIDMLIEKETVEAYHMKGKSHDCGNKLGYMQAFVEYGIRHNTLGEEFKTWLKESVLRNKPPLQMFKPVRRCPPVFLCP
jgi:UTP--glucose-1-phosphate uridylyltransferase